MVLHNFDMTYDFKSYSNILLFYHTILQIHLIARIQKGGWSRDKFAFSCQKGCPRSVFGNSTILNACEFNKEFPKGWGMGLPRSPSRSVHIIG